MVPYLGVDRSLLGQAWRERLDPGGQAQAMAMVQRHGLPDLLARVLAGRGVTAES
jgi:single-stranded-DNA-specific exonuclease